MTQPDPMQVRSRNRRMLLVLFALFFGGMLLAGLLRFSGWRPEGSKNKGELLQPYGDLREYAPTLAAGGRYGWKDEPRIWRIVAMPRDCDAARTAECTRLLADLDKGLAADEQGRGPRAPAVGRRCAARRRPAAGSAPGPRG